MKSGRFSISKNIVPGILVSFLTAAVAFTAVPSARPEAAQSFTVSEQMVGEGDLIEDIRGLKKLPEADKAAFAEAIDSKYAEETLEDYSGKATMDIQALLPVEMLGGSKVNTRIQIEAEAEDSAPSGMTRIDCKVKASAMFFSTRMERLSYIDKNNGVEYVKNIQDGKEEEWTRERKSTPAVAGTTIPFLEPENIRDIYVDPSTGAYAVVLNIDEETFHELTGNSAKSLEKVGVDEVDLSSSELIMTFDKGLAVVGMYGDLRDAIKGEEVSVTQCLFRCRMTGINTGLTISLPEEAKKAK